MGALLSRCAICIVSNSIREKRKARIFAAKTVRRAAGEGAANPALRCTSIVRKLGRMACKPGRKGIKYYANPTCFAARSAPRRPYTPQCHDHIAPSMVQRSRRSRPALQQILAPRRLITAPAAGHSMPLSARAATCSCSKVPLICRASCACSVVSVQCAQSHHLCPASRTSILNSPQREQAGSGSADVCDPGLQQAALRAHRPGPDGGAGVGEQLAPHGLEVHARRVHRRHGRQRRRRCMARRRRRRRQRMLGGHRQRRLCLQDAGGMSATRCRAW